MLNKDPISNLKNEIDGIKNKIELIQIDIQTKQQELKGFQRMLEDYQVALDALKIAGIKQVGQYSGLERLQADKGINKDTLPFDPDENIRKKVDDA